MADAAALFADVDWSRLFALCARRDGESLAALARFPWPLEALLAAARPAEPGTPYGRAPLHRSRVGDALLVHWVPGARCAPHDHGDAAGRVCLLRGVVHERHWSWRGGRLAPGPETRHASPGVVPVARGAIHDMRAEGEALGLHLYAPPVSGMRVHDPARGETLVVADNCGAWIPANPALVLSREPWRVP